jgi:hypothetical protein
MACLFFVLPRPLASFKNITQGLLNPIELLTVIENNPMSI